MKMRLTGFCFYVLLSFVLPDDVNALVRDSIFHKNADCKNAIHVDKPVFGPTNPPEGYGDILEFEGNQLGNPHFIEREHHTVWYYFVMPEDGQLTFDIIPESVEDDYDFMLFEYTAKDFCDEVRTQNIKPVRTNISRNNPEINSRTGLSQEATQKYVPAGPGDDYSKALNVSKGDTFYLLVDNVYDGGKGHTLKINFPVPRQQLTVSVVNKETSEPMSANILLYDHYSDRLITESSITSGESQKSFQLPSRRRYLITCKAEGFMFHSEEAVLIDEDVHIDCELAPISKGQVISLNNIQFEHNDTILLSHSESELRQLLHFMQRNPSLKIEIHGHVNGPFRPNLPYYVELSENRAKSIKNHLIGHGINAERMTWKGFGNTRMKYPRAQVEEEMRFNRRVEIKVTDL